MLVAFLTAYAFMETGILHCQAKVFTEHHASVYGRSELNYQIRMMEAEEFVYKICFQ